MPPTFKANSEARVLFHTHLDPDYTVVGFDLTTQQVEAGGNWWFLLAQNPTAPRFGLAENASASTDHDKLDWADFGAVPPGAAAMFSILRTTKAFSGLMTRTPTPG